MEKPEKLSKYLYALEKLVARDSFMEFIENWGITEEEYEEIKTFLLSHDVTGYITRG